jgi:hypothetical protein
MSIPIVDGNATQAIADRGAARPACVGRRRRPGEGLPRSCHRIAGEGLS